MEREITCSKGDFEWISFLHVTFTKYNDVICTVSIVNGKHSDKMVKLNCIEIKELGYMHSIHLLLFHFYMRLASQRFLLSHRNLRLEYT